MSCGPDKDTVGSAAYMWRRNTEVILLEMKKVEWKYEENAMAAEERALLENIQRIATRPAAVLYQPSGISLGHAIPERLGQVNER